MKVSNMVSKNGNKVANQFIIRNGDNTFFQSYSSIVAMVSNNGYILIDERFYKCSKTTSKYLSMVLGMDSKEIATAIKAGKISLGFLEQE